MIIDTNVKIGHYFCGKRAPIETLLESMKQNGIDQSVISCYPQIIENEQTLVYKYSYEQHFIAFFCVNPWDENISKQVATCIREGFSGVILDPIAHGYAMDHMELLSPILAVCEEKQLPVWINTFSSFFSACSLVEEPALRYPHITFILGHMGFNYDASTACELAARYENIYLETSGSMAINLKRAKQQCGAEKILWGSGYPDINYQNLAIENVKDVFDEAELKLIMGANFEKIMKKVIR